MSYQPEKLGAIKVGRYIIDPETNEVCKVISIDKSKPGKHGAAKIRMVLEGLFDGRRRQLLGSVDMRVNVPTIDKRRAQVIAINPDGSLSLMDSETYETFDAEPPSDEAVMNKIKTLMDSGKTAEVEYWKTMNRIKIVNAFEMEMQ